MIACRGPRVYTSILEEGIDVTCGMFAMPDGDRHRPIAGHHVAAGENTRMTGHHVVVDDNGVIPLKLDARYRFEERRVGVLADSEDQRVCLEFLESPGRLRSAVFVEFHDLDLECRFVDFLDGPQPVDLDALFDRLVGFEVVRRHAAAIAAVDNHRLGRTQSLGRTRRIHRRIAATVDRDPPPELRRLAFIRLAQESSPHRESCRHRGSEFRSSC